MKESIEITPQLETAKVATVCGVSTLQGHAVCGRSLGEAGPAGHSGGDAQA